MFSGIVINFKLKFGIFSASKYSSVHFGVHRWRISIENPIEIPFANISIKEMILSRTHDIRHMF